MDAGPELEMLGRTAHDLFWLSRYVERAENIARLVEVGYRIGLIPKEGGGPFEEWRSALASSATAQGYFAKYETLGAARVVDYLLFDPDNPSSVYSCLATARQNGRAQRTALTQDMWESLNSTWLEYSAIKRTGMTTTSLTELLVWIKQRSALFRGAPLGTILRNDTYFFTPRLFNIYPEGNFIEATDDTPFFQIGEHKYGKPILDRVARPEMPLADAAKLILLSFDSTLRSNFSVGMPLDLLLYRTDALRITLARRIEKDDPYFHRLSQGWSNALREAFNHLDGFDIEET